MATRTRSLGSSALAWALACSAAAHADPVSRTISSGSWYDAGNWTPGGVPTPDDGALITGGIGSVVRMADAGVTATALDLIVAGVFRGRLDQSAGDLVIGNQLTLGLGGASLGEYTLSGGSLHAGTIIAGDAGGVFLLIEGSSAVTSGRMVVANGPAGFYEKIVRQYDTSTNTVTGDLVIGQGSAGTYELRGGTNSVKNLMVGSSGSTGSGAYKLMAASALLEIAEAGVVGGGGAAGITGTLVNSGGTIRGGGAGLLVLNSSGRLYGTGVYDIPVSYVDSVTVRFDRNALTQAALLTETAGYNAANTGVAEHSDALAARTLPGTAWNLKWGGSPGPARITYKDDARASLEVNYVTADITGLGDRIPPANIEPRLRMIQFGAAITRNNASPATFTGYESYQLRNISRPPATAVGVMVGRTQNVDGNFDIGVFGKPIKPIHQDPSIARLHDEPYNLSGKGVIIGQLELDDPYFSFGCFDDWSSADPAALRIGYGHFAEPTPATDGHATRVASILAGYDPLGIQVDGQSNFAAPSQRYNGGFGFTGVAPGAQLRVNKAGNLGSSFNEASSPNVGAKIVNLSFSVANLTAGSTGDLVYKDEPYYRGELFIDGFIERRGIITTLIGGNSHDLIGHRAPAGAMNAIVVGSAQFDDPAYPRQFDIEHASVADGSPRSKAYDSLSLPHLVAQGMGNLTAFSMEYAPAVPPYSLLDPAFPVETNAGLYSTMRRKGVTSSVANNGTSFAAPTVAGVAALMVEMSRRLGFGDGEHPLVVKSILMTAADKRADWKRGSGTGIHDDYDFFPLNFEWGAGLLDPVGSVDLLVNGKRKPDGAKIRGPAWDLDTLHNDDVAAVADLPGQVYLLRNVAAGSSLTATLNWYRHSDEHVVAMELSDLVLRLWSWDGMHRSFIGRSDTTSAQNFEHLFIRNVPRSGDYLLQVDHNAPLPRGTEDYAISWDFSPLFAATSPFWQLDGGGSWTDPLHWNGPVPDAPGAQANFLSAVTAPNSPAIISLDGPRIAGQVNFENAHAYRVAAGAAGTLTLDTGSAAPAQMNVIEGVHEIAAPVLIASDAHLNVNAAGGLTVSLPVTVAAGNTLSASAAGPLILQGGVVLATDARLQVVAGRAAVASLTGAGSAEIMAGATLALTGPASTVTSLLLDGAENAWTGTLDLGDGALVVRAMPATQAQVLATLTSQLGHARNAGTTPWTAPGITSGVAATWPGGLKGIAAILNDAGNGVPIEFPAFFGLPVDASSVLLMFTWNGDSDLNGIIDGRDYARIDYGMLTGLGGYRNGDFNYSGGVNGDDYFAIDQAFLGQSFSGAGVTAPVPEPSLTSLAACACALLLAGRRAPCSAAHRSWSAA